MNWTELEAWASRNPILTTVVVSTVVVPAGLKVWAFATRRLGSWARERWAKSRRFGMLVEAARQRNAAAGPFSLLYEVLRLLTFGSLYLLVALISGRAAILAFGSDRVLVGALDVATLIAGLWMGIQRVGSSALLLREAAVAEREDIQLLVEHLSKDENAEVPAHLRPRLRRHLVASLRLAELASSEVSGSQRESEQSAADQNAADLSAGDQIDPGQPDPET